MKMQLLSLKTDGVLTYSGLESTFAEELALDLDEEVDNVVVTLQYLRSCGLIETSDEIDYFLPYVAKNTGSETTAAERMRSHRAKKKDEEIAISEEECNIVTPVLQNCYVEKEKIKDIEKNIEENNNTNVLADDKRQRVDYQHIVDLYNSTCKSFSKVMALTDKRKKAIKSMLNRYTESEVLKVFEKAEASDFMKSGSWCGFDWLMKEANFVKVIEGNYDNKQKAKDKSLAQRFMEADIHDN